MANEQAEQQWLTARFPDRTYEDSLRHGRRRRIAALVCVGLVCGVIGGVIGGSGGLDSTDDAARWRPIAGFSCMAVGLVLEVIGIVRVVRRRGQIRDNWRSPLLALPFRERRRVLRQMRGRGGVPEADLPLVRGHAIRTARQRHALLIPVGLLFAVAGQFLTASGSRSWFPAVLAVVMLVALPWQMRDIRAAERFLKRHPAP